MTQHSIKQLSFLDSPTEPPAIAPGVEPDLDRPAQRRLGETAPAIAPGVNESYLTDAIPSDDSRLDKISDGISYQLKRIHCGKPGCKTCPHGPYWYAYWKAGGKTKSKYIGKTLKSIKSDQRS